MTKPVVLVNGPWFTLADGWCIALRAYVRAMLLGGLDVYLTSWLGLVADEVEPQALREVDGAHIAVPRNEAWDCYIFSGALSGDIFNKKPLEELRDRFKKPRVFYTMLERDKVGPISAKLLGEIDGVMVPSSSSKRQLLQSGLSDLQATYIPYPIFPDDPHLSLPLPPNGPTKGFYWIGKWEPRKAPDELLRSFLRAFRPGEARLTLKTGHLPPMFGQSFPESPMQVLVEELQEDAVKDNGWNLDNWGGSVRIIDRLLTPKELLEIHAENDIYVSASRGEGLDLPAFEAKLAGRRLLLTDSGGPKDFMGEHDILVERVNDMPCHPVYRWEPGSTYGDVHWTEFEVAMQRANQEDALGDPIVLWDGMDRHEVNVVARLLRREVERWIDEAK